jgi:hypothetical protein
MIKTALQCPVYIKSEQLLSYIRLRNTGHLRKTPFFFTKLKRNRRIRWHARRKLSQTIPRNIEQRILLRYANKHIKYIELNKEKRYVKAKYSLKEKVQSSVRFNVGLL